VKVPAPLGPPDLAWLTVAADAAGERTALVCGGDAVTFEALESSTRAVAARLRAAGFARGERLAVLMRPSVRFVELLHACQRLGVFFVPLNDRLTHPDLCEQLALLAPRWLAHDPHHRERSLRLAGGQSAWRAVDATVELDRFDCQSAAAETNVSLRIDPEAVLTAVFTSGTTAQPKAVLLTNENHRASARSAIANLGAKNDDRWLCCLPLCHVGGLSILMRGALYATTVVLTDHFDATSVWEQIERERVTLVSLVTPMLRALLDAEPRPGAARTLRCVLLGGGPMPAPLLERARQAGLPLAVSYGLTETASQVTATVPGEPVYDATSAGRPLPGVEVRVDEVEDDGSGEILVRAPQVTAGYLADSGPPRPATGGGWLHTGDIGRLDADGCLHVLTRRSDLIVSGGENVVPEAVESVLLGHPDVVDAAVFGIDDETWGQLVAAALVRRSSCSSSDAELVNELSAICAERLGRHQRPRRWELVAELPRTAGGKLRRAALRARIAGS